MPSPYRDNLYTVQRYWLKVQDIFMDSIFVSLNRCVFIRFKFSYISVKVYSLSSCLKRNPSYCGFLVHFQRHVVTNDTALTIFIVKITRN
jgi:hypothetical protein